MFCNEVFSHFEILKFHVKYKHIGHLYSDITCNFSNCTKSYSTAYSLLRHICTAHNIKLDKVCKTNYEKFQSNKSMIEATTSQDVNLVDYAASLKPIIINKKEDHNISLENFSSEILNITVSLITRLYSFENLNKKNVHKIINEILYPYLSDCFEILEKKLAI
jgi:hypothetical protein